LGEFAKQQGIPRPSVHEGPALGFRYRARLAVRGRANSPKIGIFQAGTHRIVDIPHCGIHHPPINQVTATLKRVIRRTGIRPYADRPHLGDLRSVQVAVERSSGRAQVVLVGNDVVPDALAEACAELAAELGDALHSLWWNGNPERTNSILGPHWRHIQGPASLVEQIGGAEIHFPPGAFGQSHLGLFDAIASQVAAWIPDGSRISEFYGGSGALSLGLASRCESLRINDQNPHGLHGLELGLAALPDDVRGRVQPAPGRARERLDLLDEADVVLLDPPRRGLDPELVTALCTGKSDTPQRILYLSCGYDSFLADAERLLEAGSLRLSALEVYMLLPYSEHVEALALFESR
jgi:tRNA/tmRNA/rRNA uracil-C5-methylase (TrmA/RlmC/RlmD family)